MQADSHQIASARMLISRLERLSADSYWAHRSSGLRGSLLRALERMEEHGDAVSGAALDELMEQGFHILEKAAREIRVSEKS